MTRTIIFLMTLPCTILIPAKAGDWSLEMAVVSGSVWRGLQYNDALALQPGFSFEHKGFRADLWSNIDFDSSDWSNFEVSRIDAGFSYSRILGRIVTSLGLKSYQFPQLDFPDSSEISLGLGFDGFLQPTLFVFRDVDAINATYAQLGFFHDPKWFRNRRSTGLEFAFVLGYGDADYKMGYFSVHGPMGNEGDHHGGQHGGSDGGHLAQDPNPGLLEYQIGVEYPIFVSEGDLVIGLRFTDLIDKQLTSPMFSRQSQTSQTALIVSVTFRLLL